MGFRMRNRGGRILRKFLPEGRVQELRMVAEWLFGPRYLHMVRSGQDPLPAVALPDGFQVKSSVAEREEDYLRVMRRSLVRDADREWFRRVFSGDPEYHPADLFILCRGDEPVGAAAAWRHEWKGRRAGLVHMVGVDPSCRRRGVGRALVLLVLHRLRDKGFHEVLLRTEDFRAPALALYRSLGFRPIYVHWTHRLRWMKVRGGAAGMRWKN
jgi:ribosomal protein S18 acetylase RimI-like enzyme